VTTVFESAPMTEEIVFAGDGVTLAGQIDYPATPPPENGYPLLFILHDATYHTRDAYAPYAHIANERGYAAFRWDKRCTGRSGGGGCGSTTQDAVFAYRAALEQPYVDRRSAVLLAQGGGTRMLGEAFGEFAAEQRPLGVVLVGNMLDQRDVLNIDAPLQILVSENDWMPAQQYGKAAADAHNQRYSHGASYFVARVADLEGMGYDDPLFHRAVDSVIGDWLRRVQR
jgi:uncharacterized protein